MANKFDVKVNVEFNAIMGRLNNALDDFKAKLATVGDAIGNKNIGTQLSSEFEKTVKKLNELNNTNITPNNVENYKKKLAELEDRLKKLKELQQELANTPFSVDINAKKKELEDKQKELQDLLNNNKGVNFKKSRDWFAENAPDLQEQKETYLRLQREIKKLTNEFNQADTAQKNYTDGAKVLDQVVNDVEDGTNKATDALKDYAVQAEKAANEKLANTIQTQVNRFIGLNAIWRYSKRYIQDLIKTYKEFDQSLVAIAAVTGQTRDQMWANISVYNKMAQSLGTTTQEVINASKLYYQQGLTTTSVLKLTEETVKLATIAELDSADATEYLTTAMNGFKLSAEESTRVTDVWANLAAKTASDVDELAIAISKVASLAENAGMEIETASAFLNQMIETTREAPENLGTALKTIIARFQELKVSEEALSDGVDANKVEKALKSAGVALRDVDGQFRDFDEVILDLSAKWNTLDRNTQRYIATIAAGSRQQSRFIAMVSDYEGLLRNVNYAYDSLGSADAQMAVFQEGLEASLNRLKSAWEGLYTSWSKSANVISDLIDLTASFVSTLSDLGAGGSLIAATLVGMTVALFAQAAAYDLNTRAKKENAAITKIETITEGNKTITTITQTAAESAETVAIKANTKAVAENTLKVLHNTATRLAAIAPYALAIVAITALIGAIVALATAEERRLKNLEKQATQLRQVAAQEKDAASNLGVLVTEIEDAVKAGEDLTNIKQKILDQFGDEIKAYELEGKSATELIEILKKLKAEKERQAAEDYTDSYVAEQEAAAAEVAQKLEKERRLKTRVKAEYDLDENGQKIQIGEEDGLPVYKLKTVWYIGKQKFDNFGDYQRELYRLAGEGLPQNYSDDIATFNAKAFIDSDKIEKETKYSQDIIENFYKSLSNEGRDEFLKDGIYNEENVKTINQINAAIADLTSTMEEGSEEERAFSDYLSGNYSKLTVDQINNFTQQVKNALGEDTYNSWFTAGENTAEAYIKGIQDRWASTGISGNLKQQAQNWALNLQTAFLNKFEESSSTEKEIAVRWVNNFQEETGKALSSLDGDELWEQYVNAIVDAGDEGVSDKLKDAFHNILDFSEVTFDHAADQIRGLSQALSQLHDVTQDGLDIDSYISLISELAAEMDAATLATLAENMAIDATTGKVKMNEEVARELAKAKIAQARGQLEAGKTAAQEQLAELQAVQAARQAGSSAATLGEVMSGLAEDTDYAARVWSIFQAVLHNQMSWGDAWNAIKTIWSEVTTTTSKAVSALQKYGELSDEELQG